MSISTSTATSSTAAFTMQISQSDYEHFLLLQTAQASQTTNTILHGSVSGMSVFVASSDKPWVLNSRASPHMIGIKEKFHSFFSE